MSSSSCRVPSYLTVCVTLFDRAVRSSCDIDSSNCEVKEVVVPRSIYRENNEVETTIWQGISEVWTDTVAQDCGQIMWHGLLSKSSRLTPYKPGHRAASHKVYAFE